MDRLQKWTAASMATLALGVPLSFAAGQSSDSTYRNPTVSTVPAKPADAKPVETLEAAAQRLRDAIHALAKAPAGPQRTQAIRDGNRALMEVNEAMANLPPDMLTAQASESSYHQAVDRLEQAAQRLRDAAHALATDPNSTRRNQTIADINHALHETQQVMADVPLSGWTSKNSASTAAR